MSLKGKIILTLTVSLGIWYLLCLPRELFRGVSYSTVVTDRGGELLGARTADDGQWRFPPCDTVPRRYREALIEFEDRFFPYHPGVNPASIVRALISNIRSGHVTSGGSTITMQVVRMSRHRERTLRQKIIEAILATRLEQRYSKKKILALYASHAPFGGNVVGIEAAAWRYFGAPAGELTWAEAATLAVLPNSPASIHPGRAREALLEKRNRLLERLHRKGLMDSETLSLSLEEPLPDAPLPLPAYAQHLVDYYNLNAHGRQVATTIDLALQRQLTDITSATSDHLAKEDIADLAAVVIDIKSGEIRAYIGNSSPGRERNGVNVDIARRKRSTGSILKPFLYCAAFQDGVVLPGTLLPDTPVNINGFTPQNFDMKYYGAVPAGEALSRSLNIPAVHLLRDYGIGKFLALLKECGFTTFPLEPDHYGLSLILGGGEANLLETTSAYANMARCLLSLDDGPWKEPRALWQTFQALKEVNRADELDYNLIQSLRKAAWKTGTSYGFRDAWAVGVTPDWAVGVWAGNADGHGVPGLIGARTAGPVLFDILNVLPKGKDWFDEPEEGVAAEVCPASGYLKGPWCPESETVMLSPKGLESGACPYHRSIDGEVVFALPPAMEWYYKDYHPEYVPPRHSISDETMEFIYPSNGSRLSLPRQLDGSLGGIVFQLAHRNPNERIWWHLDGSYIGETTYLHRLSLTPSKGPHTLTVVDSNAATASISFTIL
ncbi:MAG: penicillin-binding protein 1C [Bacteroidales bacterium]|nr:penicillin-binding protein 1C [Bacteroidales bacterium]